MRISTEILSKKWGTFHEEVHNTNQEFRHKEKEIEVAKQANEAYRESLAQKELELGRLEYKIKDGFAELEKARKHVVGEL